MISSWKPLIPPGVGTEVIYLPEEDLLPGGLNVEMLSAGEGTMKASLAQAILCPDSTEELEVGFLSTTFSKSHFQPLLLHTTGGVS